MPEPQVLILRDPRESLRKCSLTPLRGRPGIEFRTYRSGSSIEGEGRILLAPDGELLRAADAGPDLLLLDCNWRRLPRLRAAVVGEVRPRRLPPLRSAYPRRSRTFEDPRGGLASIEALYAAFAILGRARTDLLEGYHWREEFLAANPELTG